MNTDTVEHEVGGRTCPLCNAETTTLYDLARVRTRRWPTDQAACYFCYLRLTGQRPRRRERVP